MYSKPRLLIPFRSRVNEILGPEATNHVRASTTAWCGPCDPRTCRTILTYSPITGKPEKDHRPSPRLVCLNEARTPSRGKETTTTTRQPQTLRSTSITRRASSTSSLLSRAIVTSRTPASSTELGPSTAPSARTITGTSATTSTSRLEP